MTTSPGRARRWYRRIPPMVADSLLFAVLIALASYEYTHTLDDGHQVGPFLLNGPLTLAELLPLAWRRRAPLVAFLVGYAVVFVPSLLTAHTLFAYTGYFPLVIYLYTVARHCELRISRWALLGPPVALGSYAVHVPAVRDASDTIFAVIVFSIAWLFGLTIRRQALQKAALTQALSQLADQQEQRERLAVLDERTRLARDLHDVVAHAVALMLVQAGAARMALDEDTSAARSGLLAVERIGREATRDLRRLLGLLRAEHGQDSLQPAPGLNGLADLIEQMSLAGLDVELEVIGEPPALSASLSMAAYRVVQEALTNVVKHAGSTAVLIRLDYRDPIHIEVIDAGPRSTRERPPSSGHGLLGMRERVALFGGTLRAARHDDGFAVSVELPLPGGPR